MTEHFVQLVCYWHTLVLEALGGMHNQASSRKSADVEASYIVLDFPCHQGIRIRLLIFVIVIMIMKFIFINITIMTINIIITIAI